MKKYRVLELYIMLVERGAVYSSYAMAQMYDCTIKTINRDIGVINDCMSVYGIKGEVKYLPELRAYKYIKSNLS